MKLISMKTGLATALAASAAFATPALAGDEARTVHVEYGDLDLASQEGQDELQRRIDRAALLVCEYEDVEARTRDPHQNTSRCYREVRRGLMPEFTEVVEREQAAGRTQVAIRR